MAKILIIDDDKQVRDMVTAMLNRKDYETLTAGNGNEGLRLYDQERPDLVITDLIMPDKEGIETIMDLFNINSEVKIIAISGGGRLGPGSYLQLAKQLGAKYTFTKPVPRQDLLAAVEELLNT